MKTFSIALLASAVSARGNQGGIKQGYGGGVGASHGYGYNVGNDYSHGDSHGQGLEHQIGYGSTQMGFGGAADVGNQYTVPDAHDHMTGYDSVKSYDIDDPDWITFTSGNPVPATTFLDQLKVQIDAVELERRNYIQGILDLRRDRLESLHDDNILKIEAPFDIQLDLLVEEQADITQAQGYAEADATDAWQDLQERIQDYLDDRLEALDREADRVARTLERAVDDSKPADQVLYAMRLDWLQGVYVSGATALFDKDIFDKQVYDSEFDLFTYDIGHGKGHGHRTGAPAPLNDREQGFVYGAGGDNRGDISQLNGDPLPVGGRGGRYDRQTQSGHGAPNRPSDYQLGIRNNDREGEYGYNQAADLQVDSQSRRGQAQRRQGRRQGRRQQRRGPRRGMVLRDPYRNPFGQQYGRQAYRRPQYQRRPKNPVQRTRQISKRSVYDDYAPIRRGRYY